MSIKHFILITIVALFFTAFSGFSIIAQSGGFENKTVFGSEISLPEGVDSWEDVYISSGSSIMGIKSECAHLTELYIPEKINNVSITEIAPSAFSTNNTLLRVDMPYITEIGKYAFSSCTSLTEVNIPKATSIGTSAFRYCSNLIEIDLPNVTSVGNEAFQYCSNLIEIDLPNVTLVKSYAFAGCSNLIEIDLPNVTSVEGYAFWYCSNLIEIDLPNVTSVGSYAFAGCSSLMKITIPSSVTTIRSNAFSECYKLVQIRKDSNQTLKGLPKNLGQEIRTSAEGDFVNTLSTQDGVTLFTVTNASEDNGVYLIDGGNSDVLDLSDKTFDGVYNYAFYRNETLTQITLPESCTSVRDYAFYECANLTKIDLPNVTSVGDYAFKSCSNLIEIDLPNVTSVGDYAFRSCSNLIEIDLPNVTSVGDYAFWYCSNLIEIDLPNVTSVGDNAFRSCSNLIEIDLPNVTSVGDNAFRYCSNLIEIDLPNVTSVGDNAFNRCFSLTRVNSEKDGVLEIPASIASIGANAFKDCSKIVDVYIPIEFAGFESSVFNNEDIKLRVFGRKAIDSREDILTYTAGLNGDLHYFLYVHAQDRGAYDSSDFHSDTKCTICSGSYVVKFFNDSEEIKTITIEDALPKLSENDFPELEINAGYYNDEGWYTDTDLTQQYDLDTELTDNLNLYAGIFATTYNIVYSNNLNEEGLEYNNPTAYTIESKIILTNPSEITGYTFTGWFLNDEAITKVEGLTGNLEIQARYELTVYSISYTSDKDLITFKHSNPESYRMGDDITLTNPNAVVGYTFTGWFLHKGGGEYEAITKVEGSTGNIEIQAKFSAQSYSITYTNNLDRKDITYNNPTEYTIESKITLTNPSEITGYNFLGWFLNDDAITKVEGLTGNIEIQAKFSAQSYSITYTNNLNREGVTYNNPTAYTIESKIILTNPSEITGYTFTGWFLHKDGDEYEAITKVEGLTGDLEIQARYELTVYSISYTSDKDLITFEHSNPESYRMGDDITLTNPNAVVGYTFTGWFLHKGGGEYEAITKVEGLTGELEIEARYSAQSYSITYTNNLKREGVTYNNPTEYTIEDKITLTNPSEITGYTFTGWFLHKDGDEYEAITKVEGLTGELEIEARYSAQSYSITYTNNLKREGVTYNNPTAYTIEDKITLTNPSEITGYTFTGWFLNDEAITKVEGLTGNLEIQAKFSAKSYSITYTNNLNREDITYNNPTAYTIEDKITLTNPSEITGYNFLGWFLNDEAITKVEGSTGNIEIQAKFSAQSYSITYTNNLNREDITYNNPTAYTIESKITLTNPSEITGYTFTGWFLNDGAITKVEGLTGDIEIQAKYELTVYSISYTSDKDLITVEHSNPESYRMGDDITLTNPNAVVGYTFTGWFLHKGGGEYEAITKVEGLTGNIEIQAKFSAQIYSITYTNNLDRKDITHNNPTAYTIEDKITLTNPSEITGYNFLGWFLNDVAITKVEGSTGNIAIEARFSAQSYSITYTDNLDKEDITHNNPTEYTIEDTLTLEQPESITGYNFLGWFLNDVAITKVEGSTGDIEIEARYELIVYSISYTSDKDLITFEHSNPESYRMGDDITLTNPNAVVGYTFTGWFLHKGGGEYEAITKVEGLTGNIEIQAKFSAQIYSITYTNNLDRKDITHNNPTAYTIEDKITLTNPNAVVGYNFLGWFLNDEAITKVEGSTGNIEIQAKFSAQSYSITYTNNLDKEDITYNNQTEYTIEDKITLTNPSEITGYNFLGWFLNDVAITKVEGSTGNIAIEARFSAQSYSITYTDNLDKEDITHNNPTEYTIEDTLTLEQPESITGYNFLGWFLNDVAITKVEGSTGDIEIEARYELIVYSISYTSDKDLITFEHSNPESYRMGDDITLTNPNAVVGYNFLGWFLNDEAITKVEGSTGDIEIQAKFSAQSYSITYTNNLDREGVTYNNPTTYTIEDTLTLEQPKSITGYNFLGWFLNDVAITKVEGSTGNIAIEARFSAQSYSITYTNNLNREDITHNNPTTYTIEDKIILTNPNAVVGYTFTGWFLNDNDEAITKVEGSTGNIEIQARYSAQSYSITYTNNLDKEDITHNNQTEYTIEDKITLTNPSEITGYNFLGWFLNDEDEYVAITKVEGLTGDIEIEARYELTVYSISYTSDKDLITFEHSNPESYRMGDDITLTNPNAVVGYNFLGWFLNNEAITKVEGSTGNIEIEARYELTVYSISYTSDKEDITHNNPTAYTIEDTLTLEQPESITGYTFTGWFLHKGGDEYVAITKVEGLTGDIEIQAKFIAQSYSITYTNNLDKEDITHNNPTAYTIEDKITLTNPSEMAGCEFINWSLKISETENETISKIENRVGNLVIQAQYKVIVYTIVYKVEGEVSKSSYTILDEDIVLEPAQKLGNDFLGWRDAETGEYVTVVNSSFARDVTLVAEFQINKYVLWTYIGGAVLLVVAFALMLTYNVLLKKRRRVIIIKKPSIGTSGEAVTAKHTKKENDKKD